MKKKQVLAGILAAAMVLSGLPVQQTYAAEAVPQADGGEVLPQAEDVEAVPRAEGAAELKLSFEDNLADASGKSVQVTENNGTVSYTEGIKGKAALFNGSTSLSLGQGEGLSPQNLTLSFWIKPPAGGMGNDEQLITWNKKEWHTDGWYLGTQKSQPLLLSVGPAKSGGQPYLLSISGSRDEFFPPNQWTHIAVTYDSGSKEAAVYRNGIKQALNVGFPLGGESTGVVGSVPDTTKTIGYNGTVHKGAFLKNIALDEYELYSRVYSQEDVIALYDAVSPNKFDKKAVAQSDIDALKIPETTSRNLALLTEGASGSVITWESSNTDVIALDGTVTPPESGTVNVTLKATASFANGEAVSKTFSVSVTAKAEQVSDQITDCGIENVALADEFLAHASQKESEYLLSLNSKKFLYEFYVVSGLTPPTTDRYEGWERSNGTNFRGHTFGHYMSALSQAYAGTQDADTKAALLVQIRDAVNGLKECQDAYAAEHPNSAGYVSAFRESILNKIDGTGNSDENVIVPWYNLHKVLAGLIDIYTFVSDADEGRIANQALAIAEGFTEYVYQRCSKLTDTSIMLRTEYGGMNEALYEIYDITGNERFKAAAQFFDEVSLFNDLAAGKDVLSGKHANTTIPKLTGALKRYTVMMNNETYYDKLSAAEKNNLEKYKDAAINFWDITVNHHTYVTGGNSQSEHFHDADKLYADATKGDYDGALTCETCNTYNMLRLSRELYKLTKDKKYMDYYENTYINAILSSQNPDTGTTMYFQPMAPGYNKVFNRPDDEFWCCTGTGMENFSKLGDTIYFTEKSDVYVNMYFSSAFAFAKQNLKLVQEANMPNQDEVTVSVSALEGESVAENTNLRFRIPDWTAGEPELWLNGVKQQIQEANGYAVVSNVRAGDTIKLKFPMEVKAYSTQDNRNFVAFKYGPVVLSAALGANNIEASSANGILVRVGTKDNTCQSAITVQTDTVAEWMEDVKENLVRIDDSADGRVQFQLQNTDSPDLIYTPHFMRYKERYGLYMTFEVKDSEEAQKNILRKKQLLREKELRVDYLDSFDDNNSEAAKNMKASSTSSVGSHNGRTYRHVPSGSEGWFSYDMTVDSSAAKNYLECTYITTDNGRKFDIYINDELLKTVTVNNKAGNNVFYSEMDEIPEKYWKNPTKFKVDSAGNEVLDEQGDKIPIVTVKFQTNPSTNKGPVGGLYGIAIRTDSAYATDAKLSGLSFADGKLTPAFSPSGTAYTLVVPKNTEKVTANLSPNTPSGLVYVNGILIDDAEPREIPLTGDQTMVALEAYAQDHVTKISYTVTVVRSDTGVSDADIQKANEVVAAINGIGTVSYSKESEAKIQAAFGAYQALTEAQKKLVSNYGMLEEAQKAYKRLEPGKIVSFTFDDEENGFKSERSKAELAAGKLALVDDAQKGKALSLSGGAYLNVTDPEGKALLTGYHALTISYWAKVNNGNANWAFYAAPNTTAPTYQKEVYLGILDNGGTVTAERYHNTDGRPASASAGGLKQNEWRYITVVHDSESTSIYINGEFKSKENSSYALEGIFGENGIFYIGKATWGNGEFYNGLMDEMSVYNYALTQQQVKELYQGKEPEDPVEREGSITIRCAGYTYDGKKKPSPEVVETTNTGAEVTYRYYTDKACTKETAAPVNAGTYYVKGAVAAVGNYRTAVSEPVAFKISPKKVEKATITGIKTMYYTGKAITQPNLKVKGYQAGKDYTVSYKDNKKVGKATITIKFKGNYTGSIQKSFQIKKQIPAKGKAYKVKNGKYKVTKSAASGGTVELSMPAKKTYTSFAVPSAVKINGYTFKVTSIASNAFKSNKKLTKVTIGANVSKIGKGAFRSCAKLKKITIKSKKLKSVGKDALKGIYAKATITVPKAQKKAYTKLLKGKGQKKTVKIK